MGCCYSKSVLTSGVDCLKHEGPAKTDFLGDKTVSRLPKTSHGSSTIQVGAAENPVQRSCGSNEDRSPSETSQTSVEITHSREDDLPAENLMASTSDEPASPQRQTDKHRRIGIDDEDKLELQDMGSTSEESEESCSGRGQELKSSPADENIIERLINAFSHSSFFQGLDSAILEQMASRMKSEEYREGEVVIRQGDMPKDTDCLYFVSTGEVHLQISGTQSEKPRTIVKAAGWVFGDLALLFGTPRTASVIASSNCTLYSLNRHDFIEVAKHVPKIRVLRFLRKLPFLKTVSDPKLVEFGRQCWMRSYTRGEAIKMGQDQICIVRKGRVCVQDSVSRVLSRGNFLVTHLESSCAALTDVELIGVDAAVYQNLGGTEHYLHIIEEAVKQILIALGTIDLKKLDMAELMKQHPVISASKHDLILEPHQSLKHLYIIVKGEVKLQAATQKGGAVITNSLNGIQYFGEKWDQKVKAEGGLEVISERVQLVKISHSSLADAGIKGQPVKHSSGPQLADRVIKALPLHYEGSRIDFRDLKQHRVVGEGEYGSVRLVTHRPSGKQFALKTMHKAAIKDAKTAEHVIMERKMLFRLKGMKFLVGFQGSYQDEQSIYLLMDWVPGGELFSRIIDAGGRLSDSHAVFYAANVVLAYHLMHGQDIIYRDLKPENMLIDKNGYLKLADYGFATIADGSAWTVCGTPDYQAPEIISRQGASKASDFWALGVLIYEMLTGDAPFKSPTDDRWDTHRRILSGRFYIPDYVSPAAADLINQLLQVDPAKRLGYLDDDLEVLQSHPWFKRVDWTRLQNQKQTPPFLPKLLNGMDTSCFDYYHSPTKSAASLSRSSFFDKHQPWSNLWSWIDEF